MDNKIWKIALRISICIVLVFITVSCQQTKETTQEAPKTQETTKTEEMVEELPVVVEKIGLIGFLSGGALLWGMDQQQAIGMWVNEVNLAGGLEVDGKRVMLDTIAYDDFSNTAGGLDAMQKLILQDEVRYVFGPILSSGTIAVKDIVNEHQVLQFSTCTSDIVHRPEYPYQFVYYQAGYEKAYVVSKYLDEKHPDVKKMVFVTLSDETKAELDLVTAMVPNDKRELVDTILYDRGTTDFYPVLQKALASNPDLILLGSLPTSDSATIVKQARELGYKGVMGATVGGLDMDAFYQISGDAGIGFFNTSLPSGEYAPAEYQEFVDRFVKRFGRYDTFAGTIYVMTQVLEQAILEANSLDTDKVMAVLESGKEFNTIIGPVRFGGESYYGRNSHLIFNVGVGVLQVVDGVGVEVTDGAYAVEY
jgi:branched-chain amino acid transport system substrate-binding protein